MPDETMTLASANLLRDRDPLVVAGEVAAFVQTVKPDLMGCQEGAQYTGAVRKALYPLGYDVHVPVAGAGSGANNPIVVNRTTLDVLDMGIHVVHPGKAGAYPARNVTWVEWSWVAGDDTRGFFNNTQVNSAIDQAGRPSNLPRVKLSSEHLRYMASKIRGDATGATVAFGAGDFNVDEENDERVLFSGFPAAIMGAAGVVSVYDALNVPENSFPTHGGPAPRGRTIDELYVYKGDTRLAFVPGSLGRRKYGSDHWWINADVRIRPRVLSDVEKLTRLLRDTGLMVDGTDPARVAAALLTAGVRLPV